MIPLKTCPACRNKLSAAAFNGSSRTSDGLARTCRACTNARRRELDRSRNRRPRGSQAAQLAASLCKGDIKTVRKFLHAGVKPNWCWVCETMRGGHLALAEMLLKSGVERNVFTMGAMGDIAGLARRLRRVRADARLVASMEPASQRVTPLHVACSSDWRSHGQGRMITQAKVAETLKQYGADLNAPAHYRGIGNATPLFCACWSSGNLALFRWLLDNGAIPNGGLLMVALGHFQRHGREAYDIAEALLALGLPVNGVLGGWTPLQMFAFQGTHHLCLAGRAWRRCQRTRTGRPNGGACGGSKEHEPEDARITRRQWCGSVGPG